MKYGCIDVKKIGQNAPLCQLRYTYISVHFSRPETFQTFSFGTNVREVNVNRSVKKKEKKISRGDENGISPDFSEQIWPSNLRLATP